MSHPHETEYDAEYVSRHFGRIAVEAQHRNDAMRPCTLSRQVLYTEDGSICPVCSTPLTDDGVCKPGCAGGL